MVQYCVSLHSYDKQILTIGAGSLLSCPFRKPWVMLSQLSRSWGTGSEKNWRRLEHANRNVEKNPWSPHGSPWTIFSHLATVEIRVVRLGSFQNLYLSFAIVEITHGVTANLKYYTWVMLQINCPARNSKLIGNKLAFIRILLLEVCLI